MSTGHDSRSHARGDSIALRRGSLPTPKTPQSTSMSPTSSRRRSSSPNNKAAAAANRRTRTTVLKLVGGSLVLFLVYRFGKQLLDDLSVSAQVKQRKALRSVTGGESWVIPTRWLEHDAGHTVIQGDVLPACTRTLLYKFSGTKGFASEINLYIRAAFIANKLGYTLLADDEAWQYGSLTDYFLPRQIHCRPPKDWFIESGMTPLGAKRWPNSDRIWFSRDLQLKADDWIRDETLDPNAVAELRGRRFGPILPQGETLPEAVAEVFVDFVRETSSLWRPNDQLATMLRAQRMELGLGAGGVRNRKNSPTWGGKKRKGAAQRKPVEEVDPDQHDFDEAGGAERSDRGPLIGAYVRLGDSAKAWEESVREQGIQDQTWGNLTVFLEGANDAIGRLSKSSSASPGYSRSRTASFPSTAISSLVVMSAESIALPKILADPLAAPFKVSSTSSAPLEGLKQWTGTLGLSSDGTVGKRSSEILTTFNQETFNQLPLSLRIHLTRFFLRDLTTLSLYSDAFIVSGASNVGRLACMIAGEDAVIGPRDIQGKSLGGRLRSIDFGWVPTSTYRTLFNTVEDFKS